MGRPLILLDAASIVDLFAVAWVPDFLSSVTTMSYSPYSFSTITVLCVCSCLDVQKFRWATPEGQRKVPLIEYVVVHERISLYTIGIT